jgi:lincosamide nucleotidyltransferase A/C/D/E
MTKEGERTERRFGRGRIPSTEMAADELIRVVDRLEEAGIEVWLDGGWGVDALLGHQQRRHDDLDLVVDLANAPRLQEVLTRNGYAVLGGAPPMSFYMVDSAGRQVDVHPVTFNEQGDGIYKMEIGEEWVYPAAGFAGTGLVLGRQVRCLSPEVQILVHAGYELGDKDHREIRALQEKFGVAPPPGYQPPRTNSLRSGSSESQ